MGKFMDSVADIDTKNIDKYRFRYDYNKNKIRDIRESGDNMLIVYFYNIFKGRDAILVNKQGRVVDNEISHMDVVQVTPWDQIDIDDEVLYAPDDKSTPQPGYFAGISDTGKPMVYLYGRTSFTSVGMETVRICKPYNR